MHEVIPGLVINRSSPDAEAIATSAWTDAMTNYVLEHQIVGIDLNHAKGWQRAELTFLERMPHLKSLTLIDMGITSITPIHSLHELKSLKVVTYCDTTIDFSSFPELERCSLEWRPGAQSVFDCLTLTDLLINRYDGRNADAFSQLIKLQDLSILSAPVSNIEGVRNLTDLRRLRLGNLMRLQSLSGVESLANLEELDISTCRKIGNIDQIRALKKLVKLALDNCGIIESFKPLDELARLEMVTFVESTYVGDGDLSPIKRQKNLRRVAFQNRRHYSMRREEFGKAYSG